MSTNFEVSMPLVAFSEVVGAGFFPVFFFLVILFFEKFEEDRLVYTTRLLET